MIKVIAKATPFRSRLDIRSANPKAGIPDLPVISSSMVSCPSVSSRAPDPHLRPPVSSAIRRDLFGGFASMLLLVPSEAGATKAAELDRELLACCAEAEARLRGTPDLTIALPHHRYPAVLRRRRESALEAGQLK